MNETCSIEPSKYSHIQIMTGWFKRFDQWMPVTGFNEKYGIYRWDNFWHSKKFFDDLEMKSFNEIKMTR